MSPVIPKEMNGAIIAIKEAIPTAMALLTRARIHQSGRIAKTFPVKSWIIPPTIMGSLITDQRKLPARLRMFSWEVAEGEAVLPRQRQLQQRRPKRQHQ